jgi:hypothetical protein
VPDLSVTNRKTLVKLAVDNRHYTRTAGCNKPLNVATLHRWQQPDAAFFRK